MVSQILINTIYSVLLVLLYTSCAFLWLSGFNIKKLTNKAKLVLTILVWLLISLLLIWVMHYVWHETL